MKKITYLDGLRGLAAFVVVVHHYILAFYPALFFGPNAQAHWGGGVEGKLSGTPLNLLYNGNFAVGIFFVLSGFVLSYKFFANKDENVPVAGAIKRYVRLVIPAAASVFLAFVLLSFSLFYNQAAGDMVGSGWLSSFWNFAPSFREALRQAFLGIFFNEDLNYNIVLWTISYEFLGSMLVYAFLALFGKSRNRFLFYAVSILLFVQTFYVAFILGIMLSDMVANGKTFLRKFDRFKIWRPVVLLMGLFFASFPSGVAPETTMYKFMLSPLLVSPPIFFHVLGAFLVMLVLLDSYRLQAFFANRLFIFFGKISFTMYLLHFIVLGSFSSFLFLKLAPMMSYHAAALTTFATSLAVIFASSYLTYLYVDNKAVQLSHMWYEKFFKKA